MVQVKKIEWSKEVEPELLTVLGEDLPEIRNQVKNGVCELWEIIGQGLTITRIEADKTGNPYEIVFVAGIGKDAKEVIEYFSQLAKKQLGVKKMRIHSKRKGMERYLKPLGFEFSESIYSGVI